MKTILRTTILATAALFSAVTLGQAKDLKFIFASAGEANDAVYSIIKNGFYEAGKELGIEVEYRSPEVFDMVALGQLIDAAVNQKPDGLVVTIPDGDALGPSLRRAAEAGIPVISVADGQDVSKQLGALLHVGSDNLAAGRLAGEKLKEQGGKKGICVNVQPGNVSLDIRCQGFAEGFGGPVTVLPTSLDLAENKAKIRAMLDSDPEIDTILATSAPHAGDPAVAAVAEAGREGKVFVATFDLSPGMLEAVRDGKAVFCVDQQVYLMGYLPVVFLSLYDRYGIVPAGNVPSGPRLVTKDQAAGVLALAEKGFR